MRVDVPDPRDRGLFAVQYDCDMVQLEKYQVRDYARGDRMMDMNDLIAIQQRCAQATAGPWISYVEDRDFTSGNSFIETSGEDIELRGATIADQDFIASCRQDVPLLIDEIMRLRNG